MGLDLFANTSLTKPEEVQPGVVEKLGAVIDLENTFTDEYGKEVKLGEYFDKPVILMPVYFRCPGICTPVLYEVASAINRCALTPGKDYRIISISFDAREREVPDLAKNKKAAVYKEVISSGKELKKTRVLNLEPKDWVFLTGKEENIKKLTDSLGFHFLRDQEDFIHSGSVITLSPEGKIVRYLDGLKILAMELKLAIYDAETGTTASIMHKLERLCFAYDPQGRKHVLQINRIILLVSIVPVSLFALFLFLRKKKKPQEKVKDVS
ncbi:MAG: SCO family protein [Planctomycetes bacterium]|nr:SCO family protein [Planctomycetota bacterium]